MYNYFSFALIPLIINRFSESYETTSEAEMLDFANISIIYDFFSFSLSRPFDTDGGATDPRRNAASGNAVLFIFLTRITNANLSFCEALRKPEFKCKHKGGMFDKLFFFSL